MLTLGDVLDKKFIGSDELRRNLKKVLNDFKKNGGEVVVTQNGKPKAVLVNLKRYLELEELQERIADSDPKLVKSVNKGIEEVRAGKYVTSKELFKKLGI